MDRYGNNVTGYRVLERSKEGETNASLRYSIESSHGFDDYFSDGGSGFSSDRRLKYVGKEFNSGLEKIRQLKVFNYTFKKDKSKTPHVGVIAQDLQKVFPDAVKEGKDGFLLIRMEDMFFAMINSIKELDLKYEAQEKRINELETQLKKQNTRLEKLEAKIK
ncbi:cell wall surface anchor family protein [Fusobacterium sp. CAG:439]|nr:cell wall surface anchor family protein [Fusobacterium sp. CAG:439]